MQLDEQIAIFIFVIYLGSVCKTLLLWQGSGNFWNGRTGQLEAHKVVKR